MSVFLVGAESCERSPGLGSAEPIACDGPEGRPRRGGRELDNRERGRRPRATWSTAIVILIFVLASRARRAAGGPPKAEPAADAGPAAP
jgi:hypothetical protein